MLPTKLNPLGVNPYDGVMEFEKAGNLWVSSLPQSFTVDMANGINTSNNSGYFSLANNMYKVHGTYTLSADITIYEDDVVTLPRISFGFYYTDGTTSTKHSYFRDYTYEYGVPFRVTVSNTSDTSKEISWIKVNILDHSTATSKHEKAENIMFSREGQTEYEPYNANLYRCYGESTQYKNDGRNLLPLPDLEEYTSWGVSISIKNGRVKMKGTPKGASTILKLTNGYGKHHDSEYKGHYNNETFLPAGTYTISFQNISGTYPTSGSYPCIGLKSATDSTLGSSLALWRNKLTITCDEPIAYVLLVTGVNYDIDVEFDLQIEAGSTATEYMPYIDTPTPSPDNPSPIISNYPKGRYKTNLQGVTIKLDDDLRSIKKSSSDYARDYIEVDIGTKEKSIVKECNKYAVTGNEGITYDTYYKVGLINKVLPKGIQYNNTTTMLNTHKLTIKWSNAQYNTIQIGGMTGVDSDDTCKDYLKTQYNKGTPVTIVYALAEPTITQL